MIIFGTRGITTSPSQGEFSCPQCNGMQAYKLKRVRRFFTLYFIPLIPLDKLGEYVECPSCQGTYDVKILDNDPGEEAQRFEVVYFTAVKQVMIGVLLADGQIDDNEVKELQQQFKQMTDVEISEKELREEIAVISKSRASMTDLAAKIAPQLNDQGKEKALRAAYAIAAADGVIDDSEIRLIEEVGTALGLSSAHFKGVLQEAAAERRTKS